MKKLWILFVVMFAMIAVSAVVAPAALAQEETPGAIWTRNDSCGDPQDVNQYKTGDTVWIMGSGFEPGVYEWDITGLPGSSDPNTVVASGTVVVNDIVPGSGYDFCIEAYVIAEYDNGEYKARVDGKTDNYRVEYVTAVMSVGAHVFNDANGNGVQDDGEEGLSGWEIQASVSLGDGGWSDPVWSQTDANGNALLIIDAELDDFVQVAVREIKDGWRLTSDNPVVTTPDFFNNNSVKFGVERVNNLYLPVVTK